MASNRGEEDSLDMWSNKEFPSLEQLLAEDFAMAEPLNNGDGHPDVSGELSNDAQAPNHQGAQIAEVTPHAQGNSGRTVDSLTALNLTLEKTMYMLKKTEAIYCEKQAHHRTCKALASQKYKATTEPCSVLRIGKYEVRPRYPLHLVAKWYYEREQLVWEILVNGLKKKFVIDWSTISAIRVEYGGDVETLEIELYEKPNFYCEIELRPKKHTSWKRSDDFTDGQASTYRWHHLEFPQGALERNMEPLFFKNPRLKKLARMPFPSSDSPFFVDYIAGAPQSASPLINSKSIQLHHHLHHQLPPYHSRVPTCSTNELMILIKEYERQSANHQMPSLENSFASQVSDYGYAPPPSLLRNGTIFSGQFMGHSPGEQIVRPLSHSCGNVTGGTSHGPEGYDHNSNPNLMMASQEPSYTSAGSNVAHHTHPWNNQGIFNQDMGHHSGLASSSHAPAMAVPSSSSYYPVINYHAASQGYNSNIEPCMNDTNPHNVHVPYRLIYPELVPDHDHHHPQDHQFMGDYNTANFLPSEHVNEDEVRKGSCFGVDRPPHFMP